MRTFLSLLTVLLLAGCGTARPGADGPPPASLAGPTWRLVAIGGDAVPVDAGVTLTFSADGAVSGSAGCNRFAGSAAVDARGALTWSPLTSTLRACVPDVSARETAFLAALQAADRAVVTDGELRLTGARPLRFVEASPAASATLTGTVTYLPRIALAPDAVVTVRLLDVSLADAPSVTLAEETIRPQGRQVPLPFALAYVESRIEARRRYVVRAEIRDAAGALRWTTDTAVPVLTNGAPASGVEVRVVPLAEGADRGMAPAPADLTYACEGFAFRIRTATETATVWLPERFAERDGGPTLVLDAAVAASGAKYQSGGVTVWAKGEEALLEVDGEAFTGCAARG